MTGLYTIRSQLVQVYPDTTVDAARRSIAKYRTGDLGELPFVVSERYGGFVNWLTTGSLRAPIRDRGEICHFAQVGQRVSLVICISSRLHCVSGEADDFV